MSLAQALAAQQVRAKILVLDIETTRALVETFSLFTRFIHHDRVRRPSRILCFAARWHGQTRTSFASCWRDDDEEGYLRLVRQLWGMLDEADAVVTYNGDRFDLQWVEAEGVRLGLGRPAPYRSIDLIKISKRRFRAGLLNLRLDWSARHWLHDEKTNHGGTDLWDDIRYGKTAQRRAAEKLMKTYNIHDVELTDELFVKMLPWAGINLALYRADPDSEVLRCTKCGSSEVTRLAKRATTTAFSYHLYRCKSCSAVSRGKRGKGTTELRPV